MTSSSVRPTVIEPENGAFAIAENKKRRFFDKSLQSSLQHRQSHPPTPLMPAVKAVHQQLILDAQGGVDLLHPFEGLGGELRINQPILGANLPDGGAGRISPAISGTSPNSRQAGITCASQL